MAYRIAINGYGRIGRCVLRAFYESTDYADLNLVAINDIADLRTLAHLTRYDSTHGRFLGTVEEQGEKLRIDEDVLHVFGQSRLKDLPWAELAIDLVMECSGTFTSPIKSWYVCFPMDTGFSSYTSMIMSCSVNASPNDMVVENAV